MTKKQKKINDDRIQRSVVGFQIPMGIITRLYAHAEKLIADGADDAALRAGVAKFMGARP